MLMSEFILQEITLLPEPRASGFIINAAPPPAHSLREETSGNREGV